MARFRIRSFGGLQVLDEQGGAVALPARKPAALLAFLAMQPGRALPRARLASLLWGSSGEEASRASLRQALLVVRRALSLADDELIAGPGETLALAPGLASVDALDLEAATADTGESSDLEPMAALLATIDGDFLDGLDTREPGFDDWLALRREQLRARLAQAWAQLAQAYRARSQVEPAIAAALRLLALDPLREEVHRSLMELYAGQRRFGAALHQFQLCRDLLARELGVRPQPATVRLRDAIEHQRAHLGGEPHAIGKDAPQASAELRQVVLLATESTRAGEEHDPERSQSLADHGLRAAREVVERFGGTFEPRAGGGGLGCFGAPVAHGDDEERAARCALRLVEELPDARVGLAAGLAVVSPASSGGAPQVAGAEAAGTASRLLGAAAQGEVLVASTLWRRLVAFAEGQPCPDARLPAALRGAGVHRLAGMRRRPERRTALVGRRAELAQFATLVDSCLRDSVGGVMSLRGEPGIGKTRLAEEFHVFAAGRGFAVHVGAVLGFGSGAERDAVRALVLGLLGLDPTLADAQAVTAAIGGARAAGRIGADDEAALHMLSRRPPPAALAEFVGAMDHAGRVHLQREALARLVASSAAHAPRLLILEDLHWADADTLAHAAALAGVTSRAPVLLVTTSRSDGDPLDAAWRQAVGTSAMATLDIGPLRQIEASTLAAQIADADDPFTGQCVERAGGHPLFLEQLLQAERGAAAGLPATVQAVVQARLDRLAAPEREALRVGSVLGQRFALAALDHLLGIDSAWDARRAHGLLRTDGSEGVFAHALVRDGAYASLPRARRRELHALAARWYEGRDAALYAEQLEQAEDPGAAQAWLRAALAESAAHRHEAAWAAAGRGSALSCNASVRFALAGCEAEAALQLGRSADGLTAWQRALDAAGDDAQRCQAWIGIASALRLRDDTGGAEAALDRAEPLARSLGLDEARARVHVLRGNLLFPRGDLEGCRREHEAGLELARRAGSTELEAAALGGLGDAEYLQGRMLSAERRFSACVALARRHGLRRVEAANLPMSAWTRWFAGNVRGALTDAARGIDSARAIGHLRAEAIAHHIGCLARQALNEPEPARRHAEQALELARRLGSPRFEAEALAFLGDLDAARGDVDPARALLNEAIALARASGMAFMGPVFLGMLARAAANDEGIRRAALAEAEQMLADNGLAHNHLLGRRVAIDACLAAGDAVAMRHHADCLEARTRGEPLPWSDFLIRRARALADGLDGIAADTLPARLADLADEGDRLGLLADALALRNRAAA